MNFTPYAIEGIVDDGDSKYINSETKAISMFRTFEELNVQSGPGSIIFPGDTQLELDPYVQEMNITLFRLLQDNDN